MAKNIVNITMAVVGLTLLAAPTEVVLGVKETELIRIDYEQIVLEKNPWIGKLKDLRHLTRSNFRFYNCDYEQT